MQISDCYIVRCIVPNFEGKPTFDIRDEDDNLIVRAPFEEAINILREATVAGQHPLEYLDLQNT